MRIKIIALSFFVIFCSSVFAQTHTSVALDNKIYYILEQSELKGLCAPLSGIKPYTHSVIIKAINEILASENPKKLNDTEREILEEYLAKLSKPKEGLDFKRGGYFNETTFSKFEIPISINLGTTANIEASSGFYDSFRENYFGTEIWLGMFANGDLGHHVSYEFSAEGGLIYAPRKYLGKYHTYYEGFQDDGEFQDREIEIYSEPLSHFPYTYRKRWDASVHHFSDLASFNYWPDPVAGSFNLLSELTASFADDKLIFRLGRLGGHEWGSVPLGSSLHLNQAARPFLAIELEFMPFSWFSFATMTGILEYTPVEGIKDSGYNNQKAFSISMLQFKVKNYVFLDIGSSVVWAKRFEFGYLSPITNSIFYQNNIGDFDNMGMLLNLKAQYPGYSSFWVSLFWDEAYWVSDWQELDRSMLAGQAGMSFSLPFFSFTSLKLSYTKVNPYTYTHNRNYTPWYGDLTMETAYTNNGVSLGYYLPPNSDEILVRFSTMPSKSLAMHLQYQMIRHGADFGHNAVDGSNLLSELDPSGRATKATLKRYFLQDGAYQWMHIIRLGSEWQLKKLPVTLYGEIGTVISYFTNTRGPANSGEPNDYAIINTPEYPKSTGFIAKFGFRVFAKN